VELQVILKCLKDCPACGDRIQVKKKIGECYCQACGKKLSVSGALGGESRQHIKRANTHGIRLRILGE
jgi:predicted RNA-binding Zn-ribbon protein involved in translation (DUF1610 family)